MSDNIENVNNESATYGIGKTKKDDPQVYYFTKPNFQGKEEHSGGGPGVVIHFSTNSVSGDTTFLGHFGSMIVTRGQCETSTAAGSTFVGAPSQTLSYYNANEGVNNQGCFANLSSHDKDKVRALRVQRGDIVRPTSTPYLVLREYGGHSESKALVLTKDTPSITAFTKVELLFAIGSSTGKWYLYDQENYQGNVKCVSVDGGKTQGGIEL
ncbi:hypothetical protein BB427_23015 [Pseudoalteromonas sp. BMB]|uniref:hypothetical protein n=1 Tax=Pseudoalteromonas sp. BMB TaxID=1874619 RepID=UPI00083D6831|nr:hypothetical protein [Pseudoalteromonas sp. BMB]ODB44468.1 hypothetical protein BB427_23015 [Pseudoalteromonas sp. BMB]